MSGWQAALLCASPLIVYIIARLVTAAHYRSKSDYEKEKQNGTQQQQRS